MYVYLHHLHTPCVGICDCVYNVNMHEPCPLSLILSSVFKRYCQLPPPPLCIQEIVTVHNNIILHLKIIVIHCILSISVKQMSCFIFVMTPGTIIYIYF